MRVKDGLSKVEGGVKWCEELSQILMIGRGWGWWHYLVYYLGGRISVDGGRIGTGRGANERS